MTTPGQPTPDQPSADPATAARRLAESMDRAQSLRHRPGSVDPRDADGMSLAAHLAMNALPVPEAWSTWIGPSQAKIALQHVVDAYRDGDHARAGAWLEHATVVLDANGIAPDAAAREHLDHLTAVNADRLATASRQGPELQALTAQVRQLLTRVAVYEAAASPSGFDPAELEQVQLAERAVLREQLARCPDRLLADALTERIAVADARTGLPTPDTDPNTDHEDWSAPVDALQAYPDSYQETALHSAVDQAAYLDRLQEMRQGAHQGEDPGWVRAHTVFTDRHLAAAERIYQHEIEHVEAHGATGTVQLDDLRADRDRIAAARRDLADTSRTTTSVPRADLGDITVLPSPVAELGLRALIEHYERERTRDATGHRTQAALRSRVEDYAAAHQLTGSPVMAELVERDWAAGHARSLLRDWRDRTLTSGINLTTAAINGTSPDHSSDQTRDAGIGTSTGLDAGHDAMRAIACVHRNAAALAAARPVGSDPDLPALAAAMARAEAAGVDLATRLPALQVQAPLPERHPLRELHYRLLVDCPAALPSTPGADRPDAPGPPASSPIRHHPATHLTRPHAARRERPPPPAPPPAPAPRRFR